MIAVVANAELRDIIIMSSRTAEINKLKRSILSDPELWEKVRKLPPNEAAKWLEKHRHIRALLKYRGKAL